MKHSYAQAVGFVTFLVGQAQAIDATPAQTQPHFPPFVMALREWNNVKNRLEDKQPVDSQDVLSAGDRVLTEWNRLSAEQRQHDYVDSIDSVRLVQARVLAKEGHYQEALKKLNEEVAYQYTRQSKAYLGWRGPHEFKALVCLEADILGHLGRTAHLENPDHFIAPVHVVGEERDGFVAMERSTADEVMSIMIPPLPPGEERDIVYLLQAGSDGKYHVVTNVQLIGRDGGKGKIEVGESGDVATVTLRRVTHEVELRNGVPSRYLPLTSDTVTFIVSREGFRKADG